MPLNYDRITLNPVEEDNLLTQSADLAAAPTQSPQVVASPLEFAADRFGMGIFSDKERKATWDPHEQETHRGSSVDTEGVVPLRTTVRSRPAPIIPFLVIEPSDAATTNYSTNGQLAFATTGWAGLVSAAFWRERVRDLVGFDYCARVQTPGVGANEGVGVGPVNVYGTAPYTMGVWLKGNSGGELVRLRLTESSGGASVTTQNVTLTASWAWYTVTSSGWTAGTAAQLDVVTQGTSAYTWLQTGVAVVNGSTFTEYFDGSWPGCTWITTPFASASRRPATGGPRRDAICADIERAALRTQRRQAGTLRRVLPNGHQVTFDLIGASVSWEDTSDLPAGVAKGTITFESQPFSRGPELTTIQDTFVTWRKQDYVADLGPLGDFTAAGTLTASAAAVATGDHAFVHTTSQYDFYSGEIQMKFLPGGATISGFKGGVLHRFDSTNRLECYVDDTGAVSRLRLDKVINGTRTNLTSVNLIARIANGTPFYVRLRLQDNTSYLEYFANQANDPTANTTPTLTASYALAAGQETDLFGILTANRAGFCFTPKNNADTADNFTIAPYLGRERTNPCLSYRVAGIPGSAPPLARLTITEDSGNDQYNLLVGLMQQRNQDITADNALFYEAETRTPLNGATMTFGYNPASVYTALGLGPSPYAFDDFSQDTISRGDYAFDSGAGTMVVSGGQLGVTSTALKMFHRVGLSDVDCRMIMKITTGASVAGGQEVWLNVKRLDGSNAAFGRVIFNGAAGGGLQVGKLDGGVVTSLAGSATWTPVAATSYWLRASIVGNVLTCEIFTSAPAPTGGSPTLTCTATLAGADATKFGVGVTGNHGARILVNTDYKFDDLLIEGANVVRSSALATNYAGVLSTQGAQGTGNQHTHVGDYQFLARVNVHTGAGTVKCRLSYSTGDFRSWSSNDSDAVTLLGSSGDRGSQLVNLGQVHLPRGVNVPGGSGLAQWQGRIEAKSTVAGDVLDVDDYYLIPVHEVAGTARGVQSFETPAVVTARDEFDQTAGALNAKTAPIGGAWATSGSATDLTVETTGHTATKSAIEDFRYAISGVAGSTAQLVQVDFKSDVVSTNALFGVIGRWTNVNNFLQAYVGVGAGFFAGYQRLQINKTVAGVSSALGIVQTGYPLVAATWYTIRLVVDTGGRWFVFVGTQGGTFNLIASGIDAALATGGALASGQIGFQDRCIAGIACVRNYDNFVGAPATVDAAVFASRQAEWRPDRFHRLDSGGNFWVSETQYDGDYTKVLPRDNDEQVTRMFVKGVRNEFTTAGDTGIDRIAAQASITPRWSVISDV